MILLSVTPFNALEQFIRNQKSNGVTAALLNAAQPKTKQSDAHLLASGFVH